MSNPLRWQQFSLSFHQPGLRDPYVVDELAVEFKAPDGTVWYRPGFWRGEDTWEVRFAAPEAGDWAWRVTTASYPALIGQAGEFTVENSRDPRVSHGLWRMSPGGRNLIYADGTPAMLVADTAWALPWRATQAEARMYAADRARKGFNAALLMTVQPDMDARGPRDRSQDEGFDVAFEDLPDGHLNQLNPEYFDRLDALLAILFEAGITPVLQPVFFGFGWKGLRVAGPRVPPEEYARYCRYLVARYGARPAIYLVGADGSGYEPPIEAGGLAVHAQDCYAQPTGIHYQPHADNRAHQAAEWLDFQWCQTGHIGEHVPERVMDMWHQHPVRAVANGEPSYEEMGAEGRAAGWWQGHEAWCNLMAGGTMGVVYGAGSLWNWLHHPEEPGHSRWTTAARCGWREALELPGSAFVGLVGKILAEVDLTDASPNWTVTLGRRGLLVPHRTFVCYLETGGDLGLYGDEVPLHYRVVDPRTGFTAVAGTRKPGGPVPVPPGGPWVVICSAG